MKKRVLSLVGASLMFFSTLALANTFLGVTTVLQRLENAGFTNIEEIKFDRRGYYKVETFNKYCKKLEFKVDARTGDMPKTNQPTKYLSMLQVAKKVRASGFEHVYKIEFDNDGYYIVKALDKEGDRVKFYVDALTGKFSH